MCQDCKLANMLLLDQIATQIIIISILIAVRSLYINCDYVLTHSEDPEPVNIIKGIDIT
jgi:hypothetical protein